MSAVFEVRKYKLATYLTLLKHGAIHLYKNTYN